MQAADTGGKKLEILNRFFFEGLRIEVGGELDSAADILPDTVLANRRGTCVGLAGVYLALAQLLEMPVSAVSVPNHMFVRFDDTHEEINVELLQAGKTLDDDWYVRNHRIPATSVASGVFLRSLTEREYLGYIYANLGTIYSKSGAFGSSKVLYEAALDNAPQLPYAYYNLGNDLLHQSLHRQALKAFDSALDLFPTDVMAMNNRGIAFCRLGKSRRARRDFQGALDLNPSFTQALANLADLPCNKSKGSQH